MASIGGTINVLVIIGYFATNIQNQLQIQNHKMNSLYDYSFEKKEKRPKKTQKDTHKEHNHDAKLYNWNKYYEEVE